MVTFGKTSHRHHAHTCYTCYGHPHLRRLAARGAWMAGHLARRRAEPVIGPRLRGPVGAFCQSMTKASPPAQLPPASVDLRLPPPTAFNPPILPPTPTLP